MARRSRKRTTRGRSGNNSYSRSRRTYTPKGKPRARRRAASTRAQTIRIVIENPQTAMQVPAALPQSVGAIQATTPRKARF